MSRRQAAIIKKLRADLEADRKLLRAYQLLYGRDLHGPPPNLIFGSGSTSLLHTCPHCHMLYDSLHPHEHVLSEGILKVNPILSILQLRPPYD